MAEQCAFHCIVTVLLSHLLLSSGISQLDFTTEPQDVVALQGEPLLLECRVTGKQTRNEDIIISWRHNGAEILGTKRRYITDDGSLYFEEVVVNLGDEDDRGHYQCCAKSSLGVLCSRHAEVSIAKLTRPEVIVTNDEPIGADINGTARLVCDMEAHPSANVIWFKDDTPVQMIDSQRMTPFQPGVLQITQVSLSDAGQYHCSATNLVGNRTSDSFQLSITILANQPPQPLPPSPPQPLIMAGPQNATIMAGSSYLLECAVSNTSVKVEWTKRDYSTNVGLSIPQDRSQIIGLGNLLLTGLQASDSGRYVCTVSQSSSSVTQQAEAMLFVTVPPVFTETPVDGSNEKGIINTRLHCAATGIPTPTISWLHNGRKVDMESQRRKQWENNDLSLWNIRETDKGIYQCVASNVAGEVQSSALFTFIIPDNAVEPPLNIVAVPESERSIHIMWTPPTNQTVFAYTLHYQKLEGGKEKTEPFKPTSPDDDGSYTVRNLDPYTKYRFYMRSYGEGYSKISDEAVAMTMEGVPSCGPRFHLISNSPYSIEIYWNATLPASATCRENGVITRYTYCIKQAGHKKYPCTVWSSTEQSMLTVRQLKPSTTYYMSMAAATTVGWGVYTPWAVIRTPGTPDCEVPPAFTLEWSVVNASFVQMDWHSPKPAVNVSVDGFHLVVTAEGGGLEQPLELDAGTLSYALTDLEPGGDYDVVLYAVNDCGPGQEWSETITMPALPNENVSEPAPGDAFAKIDWPSPTDLEANDIQSSSIDITWNPPLGDVTPDYYLITYWPTIDMREKPKTVYSSTCQVEVKYLSPFTVYGLTVQAVLRTDGEDIKGNAITRYFTTLEDGPSEPTNVGATPLNPHAVLVNWSPPRHPNGIISSYFIWYNHDITQPEENWNKTERNGNVNEDTIKDLNSNTTYFLRVQASNKAGPGLFSDPVLVRTPLALAVELPAAEYALDPSLQKVILASIVLVTFLIVLCTIVLVCRDRIQKRNQRQQLQVVGTGNGRVSNYYSSKPYGRDTTSNTHPMHGAMDMEMSPMLPSNANLQGNMTPGRRLGNSDSGNHSPYFTRGVVTNQGVGDSAAASYLASPHQQPYRYNRHYHSPECQVIVHQQEPPLAIRPHHQQQQQQQLIRKQGASADVDSVGTSLHTHSDTHYLPGQQFNSGQNSTPQISGHISSPQLHMDQDDVDDEGEVVRSEESVLRYAIGDGEQERHHWREQDNLGLHLPYTLSLASTTSCTTVAPCGSHDSNLPPETNHRDNERHDNLDNWGDGGSCRDVVNENEDDDSQHLPSCESMGGDSGMIDEEEWDTQDTSPDFLEKALLEISGDVSLYTV